MCEEEIRLLGVERLVVRILLRDGVSAFVSWCSFSLPFPFHTVFLSNDGGW